MIIIIIDSIQSIHYCHSHSLSPQRHSHTNTNNHHQIFLSKITLGEWSSSFGFITHQIHQNHLYLVFAQANHNRHNLQTHKTHTQREIDYWLICIDRFFSFSFSHFTFHISFKFNSWMRIKIRSNKFSKTSTKRTHFSSIWITKFFGKQKQTLSLNK